ncbi:MAG: 2-oxo acid dehydrogenase subunit E2 [Haloplanus sp.]
MGYIVRMPKLGLEMEQGTLLEWHVAEDEEVSEGDLLAEIESEKSIGEVESREDGVLRRVVVAEDESVPPGAPMGIVAGADEDITDLVAEMDADAEGEASTDADTTEDDATEPESETGGGDDAGATADAADVKASPRAERRAEELGVDLTTVEGTGPQGAVTEGDVETAAESGGAGAGTESAAGTETAATGLRRLDPDPDFRYGRETAVAGTEAAEGLLATTEAVRRAFEEETTVTDVLFVVASAALSEHPAFNATFAESTHQFHETQRIALVTGDDETAVVADAATRPLGDVIRAREDGGDDATPTFTLANGAEADGEGRLVNPPCVATLEVNPERKRAVPDGDGVDLRPLVTASLTYDARAVDGDDAAAFLTDFFALAADAESVVLGSYRGSE